MKHNTWLPRLAFRASEMAQRDTLIVIFLRGAADALNMIVPHGDPGYYALRPTLAIARPDDATTARARRAIDLDGFFGLHPAMHPLLPVWRDGALTAVHACGAPDESRSHFKAMALMERGAEDEQGPATGWIARHLEATRAIGGGALRAIAFGAQAPLSLSGRVPVAAIRSIADAHLGDAAHPRARLLREALDRLYSGVDALSRNGRAALTLLRSLSALDPDAQPHGNIRYPETPFGHAVRQTALLVKAELGLEVAALDLGGWDTHIAQGGASGQMAQLLRDLSEGLAALHADLSAAQRWGRVSVVVMSEFGRRAFENGGLGTDHGHGGALLLMGAGLRGACVHGRWPGLAREQLIGPGDLAVTTDYRDVLAELLRVRLRTPSIDAIFPGYTPRAVGVYSSDPVLTPAGPLR